MYRDERLYRSPRTHLERPKDYWMLFPLELMSTVVFLGYRGGPPAHATGFFVNFTEEGRETRNVYLVTAKHCVEDQVGLFMLINDPRGGVVSVDLPDGADWYVYPDTADTNVDIALTPIPDPVGLVEAGYRWVPQTMFFDEALLTDAGVFPSHGYNVGEELAAVGLYHVHMGSEKNLPVVRSGNLAMVPAEPVKVKTADGETREWLYLIELRSMGGMSGSPVYATHRSTVGAGFRSVSLLGVLLGGWDIQRGRYDTMGEGVGMVAPARIIPEILNQEKLVTQRQTKNDEHIPRARRDNLRPDSVSSTDQVSDLMSKLLAVPKDEADEVHRGHEK